MQFRYFAAPESLMFNLLKEPAACRFCGAVTRCFKLSDEGSKGCYACLRAGRFGFFHTTEAGYVDDLGLIPPPYDFDHRETMFVVTTSGTRVLKTDALSKELRILPVSPEAVFEMWRTPDFPTWNEVDWPVHCREFMTYLGEWQPIDFASRIQFMDMTEEAHHDMWPEGTWPPEWGINYCAFHCPACGAYRGIIDRS